MKSKFARILLADGGALSEGRWSSRVRREEVLALAEDLWEASAESASAFLDVAHTLLPFLAHDEPSEWDFPARMALGGPVPPFGRRPQENRSTPPVLSEGSFHIFRGWVEQGVRIAEQCSATATQYFRSTPAFLQKGEHAQVRHWGGWALEILQSGEACEEAASSFLRASPDMLEFLPMREFERWLEPGRVLARGCGRLAATYFSSSPQGLGSLGRSERLEVLRFASRLAETDPRGALEFFQSFTARLQELSPAIRGMALDTAKRVSGEQPRGTLVVVDEIVATVGGLSYPAQKAVMEHGAPIREISIEALSAYLRSAAQVLSEIPEIFLPNWVEAGISVLTDDEEDGIRYFSLHSAAAGAELAKWKEAVQLEDHRPVLALLARALTGQHLRVRSTREWEEEASEARQYPTPDGHGIFLAPHEANQGSREENFRLYKVSAAHQAGYVEFGTFAPGFATILSSLESLPLRDLALDIFFILEDGRIDHRIRREYRGLGRDLDLVVTCMLARRRSLRELPPRETLVEVLLRLTAEHLDEAGIPPGLAGHVDRLKGALRGFYEKPRGVWDCFFKALSIYDFLSRVPAEEPYERRPGVLFRGIFDLDHHAGAELTSVLPAAPEGGDVDPPPLPGDELDGFAGQVEDPSVLEVLKGLEVTSEGGFVTELDNVTADGAEVDANGDDPREPQDRTRVSALALATSGRGPFYYDEWDYLRREYRRRWCCLREKDVEPLQSGRIDRIYSEFGDTIEKVKRQFQRIRPELLEIVRRVEWGDELDLTEVVRRIVDRRAGGSASERIFSRREKKIRKIATLLLVDMSASTDEAVPCGEGPQTAVQGAPAAAAPAAEKRIIDIEIESLVVMAEALEALDDEYAIFGFSGYGRERVDFFTVKDFDDPYSDTLKNRIAGMQPKQSTRMGPAIRHAIGKMRRIESDQRLLILLSDGYPQDHDYGEDRRSADYALHDTRMALLEARRERIRPFCITVDRSGNDYLRKMCDPSSYLVIEDIHSLPETLPKIVEALMA